MRENGDLRIGRSLRKVEHMDELVEELAASEETLVADTTPTRNALWGGDRGALPLAARKALLKLVRGPFIDAETDADEWNALIAYRYDIEQHLNDLFLELALDTEQGIAFARNAHSDDTALPKAARSQNMTVGDTIMVLTLRRELLTDTAARVIVGKEDLISSLMQYRPIEQLDEAAFRKRLELSWSRMVNNGILRPLDGQDRAEISPVLALIFGADEVRAINEAFDRMLAAKNAQETTDGQALAEEEGDPADEISEGSEKTDDGFASPSGSDSSTAIPAEEEVR